MAVTLIVHLLLAVLVGVAVWEIFMLWGMIT